MKLGLHFTHMSYGALDPMVIELIRTERLLKAEARQRVKEPQAQPANEDKADEEIRKAA